MQRTKIEWATHVWNPTSGCSTNCPYCYAAAMARRFKRSFEPTCHPEKLDEPLRLKKPARIFVDSAGDLFDPWIPCEFIEQVFNVMSNSPQHTYQVLTKQPGKMLAFIKAYCETLPRLVKRGIIPAPNVQLGVSVTNQRDADERIPLLLRTPAAVRFVSVEPMLGPVDLGEVNYSDLLRETMRDFVRFCNERNPKKPQQDPDNGAAAITNEAVLNVLTGEWFDGWDGGSDGKKLNWVIVGGLTPKPAHKPEWVQSLINQCRMAGVPLFLKDNLRWAEEIKEYPR